MPTIPGKYEPLKNMDGSTQPDEGTIRAATPNDVAMNAEGTGPVAQPTPAAPEQAPTPEPIAPVIPIKQDVQPGAITSIYSAPSDTSKIDYAQQFEANKDANKAARILDLSRKTGLDSDFIDKNLDDVSKAVDQSNFNPETYKKTNPKLIEWMNQDQNHYPLAKDDLHNAKAIDDSVSEFGLIGSAYDTLGELTYNALGSRFAKLNASLARLPAFLYDTLSVIPNAVENGLGLSQLNTHAPDSWKNNELTRYYERAGDFYQKGSPEVQSKITDAVKSGDYGMAGRIAFANVVGFAPDMALMMASGMASGVAKANAGIKSAAEMATEYAGGKAAPLAADVLSKKIVPNANEINKGLAFVATLAAADKNAEPNGSNAPNVSQDNKTMNAIAHGAIFAGAGEFSIFKPLKNWHEALAQDYGAAAASEVIKAFVKAMTFSIGSDSTTQAGMSIANDLTDYASGVNPDALHGMGDRAMEGLAVGAGFGIAMTGPGAAYGVHGQFEAVKRARLQKDFYLSLGDKVAESKIKAKDPVAFEQMAATMTKDTHVENIYIPVEAFDSYYQSKDGGAAKKINELGIQEEYDRAKESDGLIKMKTSEFATKIAGTPDYNGLASDITFDPKSWTENEAKKDLDRVERNSKPAAEADTNPDTDPVKIMEKRLLAAGMDPFRAKTDAATMVRYEVTAKRAGIPLDKFLEQHPLPEVQNVLPDILRDKSDKDMASVLDRIRSGDAPDESKAMGPGIVDFLRSKGGIGTDAAQGADVAALEPDSNRKAFTKKLMQKKGMELDRAAEAAHEAGYLKELGDNSNQDLLDMIAKDVSGEGQYSESQGNPKLKEQLAAHNALKEHLDRMGIDLGKVDNRTAMDMLASGKMIDNGDEPYLQTKGNAPAFYNQSEKIINEKMGKTAPVEQVKGLLKDIKGEERKYLGIDDFLKGKEKVSKEDLLNFIRGNALDIKEVTKGSSLIADGVTLEKIDDGEYVYMKGSAPVDPKTGEEVAKPNYISVEKTKQDGEYAYKLTNGHDTYFGSSEEKVLSMLHGEKTPTKFESYTLPGGDNYREVLFTLPPKESTDLPSGYLAKENPAKVAAEKSGSQWIIEGPSSVNGIDNRYASGKTKEEAIAKFLSTHKETSGTYTSSHFSEKNILAHTRLNDRVDSTGKKVLFIEEIQSDWHQEGRKKGYKGESESKKYSVTEDKNGNFHVVDENGNIHSTAGTREYADERAKAANEGSKPFHNDQVPDAPFKKTWHEFVLKRLIREAAEKGYDKIGWTTGEQQADRYDLSKKLGTIKAIKYDDGGYQVQLYKPDGNKFKDVEVTKLSEMEDWVGKEITQKLIDKETEDKVTMLGNVDMKVGGSGMKGFYDKMLVDFANKFGKKFGAKVEESSIGQRSLSESDFTEGDMDYLDQEDKDAGVTGKWSLNDSEKLIGKEYVDLTEYTNEHGNKQYEANIGGNAKYVGKTLDEAIANIGKSGDKSFDEQKVHSLEITPELKAAALDEGFALFQGQDKGPLGSYSPHQNLIRLFQGQNLSTFQHESAHAMLEMVQNLAKSPDANAYIKGEYQKIRDFLGVKDGEEIGREHHEKFAEAWERYLMEGKAPSIGLRDVFDTLRSWMLMVYKKLSGASLAEINPEIRGVFDRMLATDEQIRDAKQDQHMEPMFKRPEGIFTPEDVERYGKAIRQADEYATSQVQEKAMARLRQEQTKAWKEEESTVREQVTKDVANQPEQILTEMLRSGRAPGRAEIFDFKLDKKAAIEKYGKETVDKMPDRIWKKDGMTPDILAGIIGYDSGRQVIDMLSKYRKKSDVIDEKVLEQMNAKHPDAMTDGSLPKEAMNAIHNDHNAERMMLELKYLAEHDLKAVTGMVKKVAKRMLTAKQFTDRAESIVGFTPTRDIKPYQYQRAEAKFANEAADLFTKGDFSGAFEAKKKEYLNHELFKAASKATDNMEKMYDGFNDLLRRSDEKSSKTRDVNYVNAAKAVLSAYGFGDGNKDPDSYLEKTMNYDDSAYHVVKDLVDNSTKMADHHGDVSYNGIQQLKQVVDALMDLAKTSNQLRIAGKIESKDEAKIAMGNQIAFVNKDKVTKEKLYGAGTKMDKFKTTGLDFLASLRRVEYWVDYMDAGNPDGPMRRYLWQPMSEAVDNFKKQELLYKDKFSTMLKEHASSFDNKVILTPELPKDGGFNGFENKSFLIGALLHRGNESNFKKLVVGWKWGSIDKDGNLDSSNWDRFEKRMRDEGILTAKDYEFVQKSWDLMEELKPAAQKAHKERYGYYFNEITANAFTNEFGTFKGGYAPARVDPKWSLDPANRDQAKALENNMESRQFPSTLNGFSKDRNDNYAAPLSMDIRMVPQHLSQVLKFSLIGPAVSQTSKLIHDREFSKVLHAHDPSIISGMFDPWLDRTMQQSVFTPSKSKTADAVYRGLRNASGSNQMFANVVNVIQQAHGVFVAGVKVDSTRLAAASKDYLFNPRATAEWVKSKSLYMENKLNHQGSDMEKTLAEMTLNPSKFEKAADFIKANAYFMQTTVQNNVDIIAFKGAYNQAIGEGASEESAIHQGESAVRMTQHNFDPISTSAIEHGTPFQRMFTMFYSYFNMKANLMGTEFAKAAKFMGLKKGAAHMAATYTMGMMIPAAILTTVYRSLDGKPWDEHGNGSIWDGLIAHFFDNSLHEVVGSIPFAGPLINLSMEHMKAGSTPADERTSFSPIIENLTKAAKVPGDIVKTFEKNKTDRHLAIDSLTALGMLTGVPLAPLAKPIGYMQDVKEGNAHPKNAADYARGLVTGKSGK